MDPILIRRKAPGQCTEQSQGWLLKSVRNLKEPINSICVGQAEWYAYNN